MKIWSTESGIKGLQVFYQKADGKILEGKSHCLEGLQEPFSVHHLQLEDFDYVKSVGGSFNEQGVLQTLFFASCKGQKAEFGEIKGNSVNESKRKTFSLNIKHHEVPVCVYGGLKKEEGIVMIGVEVRDDEVEEEIVVLEERKE